MSECAPKRPLPVILDTDPGVDDALALVFALRSGLFDVRAITVVAGNCHVDQAMENTFRILEALAADFRDRGVPWTPPPVYRGAEKPLGVDHTDALHVHGLDGLGDICGLAGEDGNLLYPPPSSQAEPAHAVDALVETANDAPDEITLITLGPMTNVALAIRRDPAFSAKVRRVIAMAGAFRAAGNVTPAAEYNMWADPEACHTVLQAFGDLKPIEGRTAPELVFVGLDVTPTVALRFEHLEGWVGNRRGGLSRFLWDCSAKMIKFHVQEHGWNGMFLHDPLPVICAARPDLCEFEEMHVNIEREGEYTRGMTVADRRDNRLARVGVPVKVCTSVRSEAALELFRLGVFGDPSEIGSMEGHP